MLPAACEGEDDEAEQHEERRVIAEPDTEHQKRNGLPNECIDEQLAPSQTVDKRDTDKAADQQEDIENNLTPTAFRTKVEILQNLGQEDVDREERCDLRHPENAGQSGFLDILRRKQRAISQRADLFLEQVLPGNGIEVLLRNGMGLFHPAFAGQPARGLRQPYSQDHHHQRGQEAAGQNDAPQIGIIGHDADQDDRHRSCDSETDIPPDQRPAKPGPRRSLLLNSAINAPAMA